MKTIKTPNLINLLLLLISISSYSQNRFSTVTTSSYEARSVGEVSRVSMSLQKRYNVNQDYLYDMKKWILELKTKISEQSYLTRLNNEYKDLTNIEDGDLARATKYLRQTENAIDEIISDYNIWVKSGTSTSHDDSRKYLFETTFDNASFKMSLYSEPNTLASVKYKCPIKAVVKVIDNSGDVFFKVVVDGHSGYIFKYLLKRQW